MLMAEDVISQLPALASRCCGYLVIMDSPLGIISPNELFHKLLCLVFYQSNNKVSNAYL